MLTDLDEAELGNYRSSASYPVNFDSFWQAQLEAVAMFPVSLQLDTQKPNLSTVEIFDVTFAGYGGHPIRGWLYLPRHQAGLLPGVVQYQGYGGGRGHYLESLLWSSAGYAHLVMDSRGQGSGYSQGSTGDPIGPSGPSYPGMLTNGLEEPGSHYYTRLYIDAVRAVEAIKTIPQVDASRLAVVGGSQGGALALAAAALRDDLSAVIAHVPFLCDIKRATRITDAAPYKEIGRYLATHRHAADHVFDTLAYFDGVNLARKITTPAWLSAALMDPTCPPSTVYGAYHELMGERDIQLWDYNGHEGGGPDDDERALCALRTTFGNKY